MMPAYELGNKVFVCQSSQIQKLIDGINAVSVCNAPCVGLTQFTGM